jgi:hypothetical protein
MLFDCKQRVRTEPLRRGEQLFAFYDATAGAAYRAYRRLLNKWIGELPKEDRVDTLGRMRKGDNLQFRHAFAEVVIHAALRRGGFAVTVHPPLSGRKKARLLGDAAGRAEGSLSRGDFIFSDIGRAKAKQPRWGLPPRPRSADRTRSPASVSQRREFFNVRRRLSSISV